MILKARSGGGVLARAGEHDGSYLRRADPSCSPLFLCFQSRVPRPPPCPACRPAHRIQAGTGTESSCDGFVSAPMCTAASPGTERPMGAAHVADIVAMTCWRAKPPQAPGHTPDGAIKGSMECKRICRQRRNMRLHRIIFASFLSPLPHVQLIVCDKGWNKRV